MPTGQRAAAARPTPTLRHNAAEDVFVAHWTRHEDGNLTDAAHRRLHARDLATAKRLAKAATKPGWTLGHVRPADAAKDKQSWL